MRTFEQGQREPWHPDNHMSPFAMDGRRAYEQSFMPPPPPPPPAYQPSSSYSNSSYTYSPPPRTETKPLTPEEQAAREKRWEEQNRAYAHEREKRRAHLAKILRTAIAGGLCVGAIGLVTFLAIDTFKKIENDRLLGIQTAQAQHAADLRSERSRQFDELLRAHQNSPLAIASAYVQQKRIVVSDKTITLQASGTNTVKGIASSEFSLSGFIAPKADGVPRQGQCALFSVEVTNGEGNLLTEVGVRTGLLRRFEAGMMCQRNGRWVPATNRP